LPPYHVPQLGSLVRTTWDRSKLFLTNAGTTIFAVCIVIWALSYFPHKKVEQMSPAVQEQVAAFERQKTPEAAEAREQLIASEQLRHSCIGWIGHTIEPAIRPLGFDWRLGIGILSSFLAREVFVGTMGITFAVGEADEESAALRDKLASATWPDGRKVLTPLTGIGLMVFYVLACQCVSTLAVVRKETGSWRWPALMFGYMSVLAYVGALVVHQVGLAIAS
jgi:ferrous iron transport protein B